MILHPFHLSLSFSDSTNIDSHTSPRQHDPCPRRNAGLTNAFGAGDLDKVLAAIASGADVNLVYCCDVSLSEGWVVVVVGVSTDFL